MNQTFSYLRVVGYVALAIAIFELTIDSGNSLAITKYPILWLVLVLVLFFGIALEVMFFAIRSIMYKTLSEEGKKGFELAEENRFAKIKALYKKSLDTTSIAEEDEIILDHVYDGIRELDNNLPPWWVYMFYLSIIFGVGYFLYYEVFDGPTQYTEWEREMEKAEIAIAEYRENNPNLIDASNVEMLTDASDLKRGEDIFMMACAACHRPDGGGGIGPNLTDEYWILGGDIASIYNTISEGGRPGKGMVPWKTEYNALEMAQVASYILTLQGTNPSDAKEPEGDLYQP